MRFVSFVAVTEKGLVPVAAGSSVEPLVDVAKEARKSGFAVVGGKKVPITGGCVFASDSLLQGPALEFRCTAGK